MSNGGTKGGTIMIGGDRHGGTDPSLNLSPRPVKNALTTTVEAGARISANGGVGSGTGDGAMWWSGPTTAPFSPAPSPPVAANWAAMAVLWKPRARTN